MPFLGSVSGARSGRIFSLGGKPNQVSTPTITIDNATTTTYTWSAPFNGGVPITKYGYRIYKDNGSAGTEQFTADGSVLTYSFTSQYDTSVYKIDVRAYNPVGVGPWSSISSNNVAWVENNVTRSQSCSCSGTDTSGCDSCGSRSSTTTGGTQSRNCKYKSKTGYDNGPDYGCDANFTTCASCNGTTTYGSCSGTRTYYTTTGVYDGISYTEFTDWLFGTSYLRRTADGLGGCGCDSYYAWQVSYCNISNTWTHTPLGCVQWVISCGGGGKIG